MPAKIKTLLLDAGNTRLKWAVCEDGQLSQQGSLRYEWPSPAAQLDAALSKLFDEVGLLAGVTLCNVAGKKLAAVLEEKLQAYGHCQQDVSDGHAQGSAVLTVQTVVAQPDAYGVRCAYEHPEQLGADRWAALVAARHHCAGVSCIIDCGTAMTIDVLTADGRHAGGIIIPGMEMMKSSLVENTDGVFASDRSDISLLSVTNTEDAVQAGVVSALRGAVQLVLQQCRDELGETPTCVLTGGNAGWLLPVLPDTAQFEPDWVLKGLAVIAIADR